MASKERYDILTKLGAYKSLCEAPDPFERVATRLPSVNSDNANLLPFLIDAATVLLGASSPIALLQEAIDNFLGDFEGTARSLLLDITQRNALANTPLADIPCFDSGVRLPSGSIDFFGKLKGDYINLTQFERALKDASISGQSISVSESLNVSLDRSTGEFVFRLEEGAGGNFGDLMAEVADATFTMDFPTLAEDLLNAIFGIRKSPGQAERDRILDRLLEQEDPQAVNFTRFDFLEIERAKTRPDNGVFVGGCDPERVAIDEETIAGLITDTETFSQSVSDMVSDMSGDDQAGKDAARGLLQNLLTVLLDRLLASTSSVFIYSLFRYVSGGCDIGGYITNFQSYVNENIQKLKCLVVELRESFFEFLVDVLEEALADIISCIAEKYARERLEAYIRITKSLLI